MRKIIEDLKRRGLNVTAAVIERELTPDKISYETIRANKSKIVAFANRLSAMGETRLQRHARTLLQIADESERMP